MATQSGTSISGVPFSITAGQPLSFAFSVAITSAPLPPQVRVGYFWLYAYIPSPPFQCFMIKRGAIYQPGILEDFPQRFVTSAYALRADIVFDESGLSYTVVLI